MEFVPMTHSSSDRENCLERARMHEQLACSTADSAARQMHQAMAAEFRRRADQMTEGPEVTPQAPIIELHTATR